MANELTIKQGTTPQQIENFLANEVNQDRKVLARHNERGELVLYEKPKASGLRDKLSAFVDRVIGRTERRLERAADVVMKAASEAMPKGYSDVREALSRQINQSWAERRLQGTVNAGFMGGVLLAARSLPSTATNPASGNPTLRSLGIGSNDPAILEAASALAGDRTKGPEVATKLGDLILDRFLKSNPRLVDREGFARSDGIAITTELRDALRAALHEIDPKLAEANLPNVKAVLQGFLVAASKVLPDGVISTKTKQLSGTGEMGDKTMVDVPNIHIGAIEYEPVRYLGTGGFADVYEYKAVKDDTARLALKITHALSSVWIDYDNPKDYCNMVRESGEEVDLHRRALGSGCKEVVGLKGHLRMPNGNFAIAMELAPNGDVKSAGVLMDEALKAGNLTRGEVTVMKLTMLKDMLRGLVHMHDVQGVTHVDFKSPNCFIGVDGTAKVGDFGLTQVVQSLDRFDSVTSRKVENPHFKAPELLLLEDVSKRIDELTEETKADVRQSFVDRMRSILGIEATSDLAIALSRNVVTDPVRDIEEWARSDKTMLLFDRKVDVWGLGASALLMLTGRFIAQETGFNQADIVRAFGLNRNNQPLSDPGPDGNPQPGSIGLRTGNAQLDDLLSRMLMPDPDDRSSARQLLSHPALQARWAVDSKQARDLIVALKGGDPQQIAQARQALARLIPPRPPSIEGRPELPVRDTPPPLPPQMASCHRFHCGTMCHLRSHRGLPGRPADSRSDHVETSCRRAVQRRRPSLFRVARHRVTSGNKWPGRPVLEERRG